MSGISPLNNYTPSYSPTKGKSTGNMIHGLSLTEVLDLCFPRTSTMIITSCQAPWTVFTSSEILTVKTPRSQANARHSLGLTRYHSIQFFSNTRNCTAWNAAHDAKFVGKGTPFRQRECDALLGSFSAISADPPTVTFVENLWRFIPTPKSSQWSEISRLGYQPQ